MNHCQTKSFDITTEFVLAPGSLREIGVTPASMHVFQINCQMPEGKFKHYLAIETKLLQRLTNTNARTRKSMILRNSKKIDFCHNFFDAVQNLNAYIELVDVGRCKEGADFKIKAMPDHYAQRSRVSN